MKPILRYILTLFLLTLAENFISAGNNVAASEVFTWKEHSVLPPSPAISVQPGLAGAFSGVADGLFIVAGGANFPDRLPWMGGTKTWWDDIYVYNPSASQSAWEVHPQKLPRPLAYGVSVSLPEGVLCIGGCDHENSYAVVFLRLGILFAVMMGTWVTWDIKSLWDEFNIILGLVMGGLFLLGMVSRRANGTGALAGIIGSILVQVRISKTQPGHLIFYAPTGFISYFLIGFFASLIFSKDRKGIAHLTIYKHCKINNSKL